MRKLETKYEQLPDISIAYTEHGEGPVLILLHGNSESKKLFRKYQTEYFKDFHTFALDSRGHGESVSNDLAYSIPQYARDVAEFCRKQGLAGAHVLGFSDGANIVLALAKEAPDLFDRMIAVSPNYLAEGTVDKWLTTFRRMRAFFAFMTRIGIDMRKPMLRFDLMLTDIGLSRGDLEAIRKPLLILYADKDMIKEEHILDIHARVRDSKLVKIPGCTHLSILQKSAAIRKMHSYLAGEGAKTS